jgi:hypothetical protein
MFVFVFLGNHRIFKEPPLHTHAAEMATTVEDLNNGTPVNVRL